MSVLSTVHCTPGSASACLHVLWLKDFDYLLYLSLSNKFISQNSEACIQYIYFLYCILIGSYQKICHILHLSFRF